MHVPELAHSQNFLHSAALVKTLINSSNINRDDLVIEIGPGKGIITKQLAEVCSRVIAIEYDADLFEKLKRDFRAVSNVAMHYGDFLAYDLPKCEYKIFASMPFSITSAILARITKGAHLPTDAYLVVQEEAARKYSGLPYAGESLKSLLIKPRFEVSVTHRFADTDFSPVPRAHVVLLHIHKRLTPLLRGGEYGRYKDFLCFVFTQPGKVVGVRMRSVFTKLQITRLAQEWQFSMTARLGDLSVDQWLGVFAYYVTGVSVEKRSLVAGAENRLLQQQSRLEKMHRNRRRTGPKNNMTDTG